VRFGVLAALAGGATAIVAETARPGSVRAIMHQAGTSIGSVIDHNINETTALRAQIRDLEAEYPGKIAEVRSDLTEVRDQIAQLERERDVSDKVVDLTMSDLDLLDTGVARARSVQDSNQGAMVRISFNEHRLDVRQALEKRQQIAQTKAVYQGRVGEIDTELSYLAEQEAQLADLLHRLQTEHAEFQAQLFQIEAQIDSIERNERLIAMMEDRQKTIDEHSRYRAHSLEQLHDRLSRVRGEQQSRIAAAATHHRKHDYVAEAQYLVDQEAEVRELIEPARPATIEWEKPDVIEIDPSEAEDAEDMASRD
jgi:chromosome segregation ATPase